MNSKNLLITLLGFTLITACSASNSSDPANTSMTTEATGNSATPAQPSNSPATTQDGPVVSRVETAGGVSYKIYLQDEPNATNRKGLILLGSGNDESDPSTGSLDGALENNLASHLAKLGYVSAIVAYRDEAPVNFADGGVSWNTNTAMLATDMSNVADAIIAKYGNGLSRSRVLTGGVSYTSYALLTNIADDASPLKDTRGVLATCGSTQDASSIKIPVYSLACSGNNEGDLEGDALVSDIGTQSVRADSGAFIDPSCNTHCGGDTNTWTDKLVERVQTWLP